MKSIFYFLAITIFIVGVEFIGTVFFIKNADMYKLRGFLMESKDTTDRPLLTAHPYLSYICTPNLSDETEFLHNEDGYRGKKVPLEKDSSTIRILFLGGSTTYGTGCEFSDSTYPALIGDILNKKLDSLHANKTVEVINGGLPWGTSFEIHTHYVFKYRYYQPDLVVIQTGGNDAMAYPLHNDNVPFQADYTHWRKSFAPLKPWPKPWNYLLRSRFISAFVIKVFYNDALTGRSFVHSGKYLITDWFHFKGGKRPRYLQQVAYNPFYRNISMTVREIRQDGGTVLLVPFALNLDNVDFQSKFNNKYVDYVDLDNAFLKRISKEMDTYYNDFNRKVISNHKYWMDECHLRPGGQLEKSAYIAPTIFEMIKSCCLTTEPDSMTSGLK